jgi:hypothetical protein
MNNVQNCDIYINIPSSKPIDLIYFITFMDELFNNY